MKLTNWLSLEAIRVKAPAESWRDALRLCGDALESTGATEAAYTDQMIQAVEDLGPYIVIAPGIALAHSRPTPAVKRLGVSWVSLENPVSFGSEANDPVDLVIGLAALDHDSHLELMSAIARTISSAELLQKLRGAESAREVHNILDFEA